MSRVHIISDSTAHFPDPTLPDRLGVTVVPQAVPFGRQTYREGVDISAEEFFRRLPHYGTLPALHPPTAEAFRELYAEKFRQNKQILSIHISGKMSETVAHARQAADEFLGGNKIVVIDSLTTSIGLGWLVEAAAEAAAKKVLDDKLAPILAEARRTLPEASATAWLESERAAMARAFWNTEIANALTGLQGVERRKKKAVIRRQSLVTNRQHLHLTQVQVA